MLTFNEPKQLTEHVTQRYRDSEPGRYEQAAYSAWNRCMFEGIQWLSKGQGGGGFTKIQRHAVNWSTQ